MTRPISHQNRNATWNTRTSLSSSLSLSVLLAKWLCLSEHTDERESRLELGPWVMVNNLMNLSLFVFINHLRLDFHFLLTCLWEHISDYGLLTMALVQESTCFSHSGKHLCACLILSMCVVLLSILGLFTYLQLTQWICLCRIRV